MKYITCHVMMKIAILRRYGNRSLNVKKPESVRMNNSKGRKGAVVVVNPTDCRRFES